MPWLRVHNRLYNLNKETTLLLTKLIPLNMLTHLFYKQKEENRTFREAAHLVMVCLVRLMQYWAKHRGGTKPDARSTAVGASFFFEFEVEGDCAGDAADSGLPGDCAR